MHSRGSFKHPSTLWLIATHLAVVVLVLVRSVSDLRAQAFFSAKRNSSGEPESIFIKVYASAERLLIEADNVDQKLVLDREKLREADQAKNEQLQQAGLRFNPDATGSYLTDLTIPVMEQRFGEPLDPYDHIFAPVRGVLWRCGCRVF